MSGHERDVCLPCQLPPYRNTVETGWWFAVYNLLSVNYPENQSQPATSPFAEPKGLRHGEL
jgi:hypothetical protein